VCDIQTATAVSGGSKMDIDKEAVQIVAVVGGVAIAVTALIVDGDIGYAMGTSVLTIASAMAGYIFGKGACEDEEKVQK